MNKLIVAIAIAMLPIHAAENKKALILNPVKVVLETTYGNNNFVTIAAEKLAAPINLEYKTTNYCCGNPYISFTTMPMGKDNLDTTCYTTRELSAVSFVSFYDDHYKEEKQTIPVLSGNKLSIVNSENGICILKTNNSKEQEGAVVASFTLKK